VGEQRLSLTFTTASRHRPSFGAVFFVTSGHGAHSARDAQNIEIIGRSFASEGGSALLRPLRVLRHRGENTELVLPSGGAPVENPTVQNQWVLGTATETLPTVGRVPKSEQGQPFV
jgi:hypothetical protein